MGYRLTKTPPNKVVWDMASQQKHKGYDLKQAWHMASKQNCMGYHLCLHLSLNRRGHWGTTDDFTTTFLQFSLLPTAL